jgi:hypothetical protein
MDPKKAQEQPSNPALPPDNGSVGIPSDAKGVEIKTVTVKSNT